MNLIISLLITSISVIAAAYIVPGVVVANFTSALVVAIVLGLLNLFVKPVLLLLTLPVNLLTLGLFTLVINVIILYMASSLVQGFTIDNFLSALLFGLLLSLISSFLASFTAS